MSFGKELTSSNLGVHIEGDLVLQLHDVDDNIGKSRRILNSMARRMTRNKWIMGSIISILILAIVLVIYLKLSRS